MTSYIQTEKAVEDLTNIWDYTCDKWSENHAEIYYQLLVDSFVQISKSPNIGESYIEISSESELTKEISFSFMLKILCTKTKCTNLHG